MKTIIQIPLLICFLGIQLAQARSDRPQVTYVTAFFDIGRSNITTERRTTPFYMDRISELLSTTANIIFFGEESMRQFVESRRSPQNTLFVEYTVDQVKQQWTTKRYLKTHDDIYNKSSNIGKRRLDTFKTYQIPLYIPIMYLKVEWLLMAYDLDPFDSQKMYWVDSGFTHVEHVSAPPFNKTNLYEPFQLWAQNTWTFQFMWWDNWVLFHPNRDALYMNYTISHNHYCIGGLFGGRKDAVIMLRNLIQTLNRLLLERDGQLSDEAAYTLSQYRYPLATFTGFAQNDTRGLNITFNDQLKYQRTLKHTVSQHFKLVRKDLRSQNENKNQQASDWGLSKIVKKDGQALLSHLKSDNQKMVVYLFERIAMLLVLSCSILWLSYKRINDERTIEYEQCPSWPEDDSSL